MFDRRRHPLPVPLVLLLLASLSRAAVQNDFSLYPKGSQTCLTQASSSSGCSGDTVAAMNSCLCSNGGNFVTNTAKCLGTSDVGDVLAVYDTMSSSCTNSKTPLNVEKAVFFSAAGLSSVTTSAKTTSSSKTTTATATTTPPSGTGTASTSPSATDGAQSSDTTTPGGTTGGDSSGSGSLSGKAKAGIIAASVSSGLALLGVSLFFFIRYRKKRDSEESHPMLPQKNNGFGGPSIENGPLPSTAEVTALGANEEAADWPQDTKWRPTPGAEFTRTPSGFNWESPYDSTPPIGWGRVPSAPPEEVLWSPPSAPPSSKSPSALSIAPSQVYELQGSARPVEIAGTPILAPGADKAYSGEGWGPGPAKK
ncbi:hypothetical protein GQ53DRAFT_758356 [Thozetella sp. PMI_491]|nr:hypothetical protein GQ53DRAFT_758356 [Thozetella sp. PMI_491]